MVSSLESDKGDELIPILGEEFEDINNAELDDEILILPIKNTVLFPGVVIPITVGRKKAIRLVKKSYQGDRVIGHLLLVLDCIIE